MAKQTAPSRLSPPPQPAPGQIQLRIIGTSDVHMRIRPHNYFSDTRSTGPNLVAAAPVISALRNQAANSLLFDNGDLLQGNPMADYLAHAGPAAGRPHPAIAALNAAGYDAAGLGNHDFDYGISFLQGAIAGAAFPYVCANVVLGKTGTPWLAPYTLLKRNMTDATGNMHRLRIGVIGLVPPQTKNWNRRHFRERLTTRDMVETAQDLLPEMRAQGADVIIALAHTGIGHLRAERNMENAAFPLARLDGLDALILGHSHLAFPSERFAGLSQADCNAGTIEGTPAVMPGSGAGRLGVLDLLLEKRGQKWRVATGRGRIAEVMAATGPPALPQGPTARTILRATDAAHKATREHMARAVGHVAIPLNSHFAQLGVAPAQMFVADAQLSFAREQIAGTRLETLPLLSATAPFKAGGRAGASDYTDIPAGELVMRHLADLYPYPNRLHLLKITGASLANWLERAAGMFNTLKRGNGPVPLLAQGFAAYDFDAILGVQYEIDLSQPPRFDLEGRPANPRATRIRNLRHEGKPVQANQEFLLVTNNFRAAGGGSFEAVRQAVDEGSLNHACHDALVHHIRAARRINTVPPSPWRFTPLGGIETHFATGPGALGHRQQIEALSLTEVGCNDAGFVVFSLHI